MGGGIGMKSGPKERISSSNSEITRSWSHSPYVAAVKLWIPLFVIFNKPWGRLCLLIKCCFEYLGGLAVCLIAECDFLNILNFLFRLSV